MNKSILPIALGLALAGFAQAAVIVPVNFTDCSSESKIPRWFSTRSAVPAKRKNHVSPPAVSTTTTRLRFAAFPPAAGPVKS